ncbi:type II secretion system protein GspD [Tepidimonas taiwanensis]|uniref:type II secretion system protein GspD n=1 Tax=Tepidimonas taiwanensis TaxID=307486 RepID=UPI00137AD336|nr:type II and III secretion system protein [Tepidimonas taiwanensis]
MRDLLYAIARDAKLNLDVHPGVDGRVTMQVVEQTLTDILDRLSEQLPLRYEVSGRNLLVLPDEPVLRQYRIDYLNVERNLKAKIGASSAVGAGQSASNSETEIDSVSANQFWARLTANVREVLGLPPTDAAGGAGVTPAGTAGSGATASPGSSGNKASPTPIPVPAVASAGVAGSTAPPGAAGAAQSSASPAPTPSPAVAPSAPIVAAGGALQTAVPPAAVIANPEAGLLAVRATHRQHKRVREFLQQLLRQSAQQVLIEATVVEVELFDEYQQGINWTLLRNNLPLLQLSPSTSEGALPGGTRNDGRSPAVLTWTPSLTGGQWRLDTALRLLESFGNTRVLSSPKISAVQSQPALLKVTREEVYFRIQVQYEPPQVGLPARFTVSSEPNTVSIGLVMQVIPQIGEGDEVTLSLRPTLTDVKEYLEDPGVAVTLALARQNIPNLPNVSSRVPVVLTREMESIVRVRSGDVAILGGLMRESAANGTDQVPGVGSVPLLGEAFKFRSRRNGKSELVIFLRPTVVSPVTEVTLRDEAEQALRRLTQPLPTQPVGGPTRGLWQEPGGGS